MIRLTMLLLLMIPNLCYALLPQPGVLEQTVQQIKESENASKLKVWSWVGFVGGNDEYDSLHKIHKRSTFISHNENTETKDHFIIVWFHGMGGYKKSSFEGAYGFLKWMEENNISNTWIMPELPWSVNVSNINNRQAWKTKDSFKLFFEESLSKIPKLKSKKNIHLIIAGHSRGGKSISMAARYGGLCETNPSWIIWSDATYGNWLQEAWGSCLKDYPVFMEIYYLANTSTSSSVKKFQKTNNNKLVEVHELHPPWYHGKIGNSVFFMTNAFRQLFTK